MLPHDVNHGSPDERILNDEGIEIGSRISNYSAHNWVSAAYGGVINIGDQGGRVKIIE